MAVKKVEKKADKKAEKKAKEIRQERLEKYDKKALDACFALSETYRQFNLLIAKQKENVWMNQ